MPQYNNPKYSPPPASTGLHPNYASAGVTPQGGILMPIPRIASATAGTISPGAPVPPRPYQYHTAPSTPIERRAPAPGRRGLSGFATAVIVIIVCLLIGGGIYYFTNRPGTTPTANNIVNTSLLSLLDVSAQSITETSATIKWTTDKPATGLVKIRDANGTLITTGAADSLIDKQSLIISGLSPNTKYYYTVTSTDSFGNEATSEGELTTLGTASVTADKTPPSISGASSANITESSAIITWVTDEPATGQVKYIKDGGNTSTTPMDSNLSTTHSVMLTNLDSDTTYSFNVISRDASGNEATSTANQTFTTLTPIPVGSQVGNRAPDFTLQNLEGENVTLSSFRGKLVMINFWAVWCDPCTKELPYIQAISQNWTGKQLVVLAIAAKTDEQLSLVNQFVKQNQYTFPVMFDSQGVNSAYNVNMLPTTFFIDADGIIRKKQVGSFQDRSSIESVLNSL